MQEVCSLNVLFSPQHSDQIGWDCDVPVKVKTINDLRFKHRYAFTVVEHYRMTCFTRLFTGVVFPLVPIVLHDEAPELIVSF